MRVNWTGLIAILSVVFVPLAGYGQTASPDSGGVRQQMLLSDATWQFVGGADSLLDYPSPAFDAIKWTDVQVPHDFQTRQNPHGILQGWYRRTVTPTADMAGKRLYLVFEGAATVADVYVNGTHLGQHRGGYTRFIFDATDSLKTGSDNVLLVHVDNRPASITDCLPSIDGLMPEGLYKVWGGLYRKVWLVAADPLSVDPTDDASPGVYITPSNVTAASADLSIRVLVRNTTPAAQDATIRATLLDPAGNSVQTMTSPVHVDAGGRAEATLTGSVANPKMWGPRVPQLYHVRTEIAQGDHVTDAVVQPTGFRSVQFVNGTVIFNGKQVTLMGANVHQEIESKGSAVSDADLKVNFDNLIDLGATMLRLPHYPHAQYEYDQCDQLGICCWAENGHSDKKDIVTPTGEHITTEMVKQNFNHPAILVWSVGNEASPAPAQDFAPIVRKLDPSRPVVVANMQANNVDFHGANTYPGWYGGTLWSFKPVAYISETGGGGVITCHCDYADARHIPSYTDHYEPEEIQQVVAEAHFQQAFREADNKLGFMLWWTLRDFNDHKYKGPIGENTKGLTTYAGFKKDVYYLYRSFLRPDEPTVHLDSKLYFLRQGRVDNGIKAYSNAANLTLTINGETISTLPNGQYLQTDPDRPTVQHRVDNVFYWPTKLHTGRNDVTVSDRAGHTDSGVIYFYGKDGLPEMPEKDPLVTNLKSSNPQNPAYYMNMPVQDQWPIYDDLDSTADNSFDQVPDAVRGATWITSKRETATGMQRELDFTVARAATIYVMCDAGEANAAPPEGFTPVNVPGLDWRNNDIILVPAQLYSRTVQAGQTVHIAATDRNQIVMIK